MLISCVKLDHALYSINNGNSHELQKIHISGNFNNLVEYNVCFLVHFWAF